jgi:hypothetical protein
MSIGQLIVAAPLRQNSYPKEHFSQLQAMAGLTGPSTFVLFSHAANLNLESYCSPVRGQIDFAFDQGGLL